MCPSVRGAAAGSSASQSPVPHFAVSADAVSKATRYMNTGSAQRNIHPSTSTYLGHAAREVLADYEGPTAALVSKAQQRAAAAAAAADADVDGDAAGTRCLPCDAQLACSREVATAHGVLDCYGLVAVCCAHGFPGLGLVLPMLTPEQHYYYDVLMEGLFRLRPEVRAIYIDLMCRYHKRLDLLQRRLVVEGVLTQEQSDGVMRLLPWMHAYGHNLQCQKTFSGLYQVRCTCPPLSGSLRSLPSLCELSSSLGLPALPSRLQVGAGRRIGEQTEPLWALIQPVMHLLRYAARRNWYDGYNFAFALVSQRKLAESAGLLDRRIRRNNHEQSALHGVLSGSADACGRSTAWSAATLQGSARRSWTIWLRTRYVDIGCAIGAQLWRCLRRRRWLQRLGSASR